MKDNEPSTPNSDPKALTKSLSLSHMCTVVDLIENNFSTDSSFQKDLLTDFKIKLENWDFTGKNYTKQNPVYSRLSKRVDGLQAKFSSQKFVYKDPTIYDHKDKDRSPYTIDSSGSPLAISSRKMTAEKFWCIMAAEYPWLVDDVHEITVSRHELIRAIDLIMHRVACASSIKLSDFLMRHWPVVKTFTERVEELEEESVPFDEAIRKARSEAFHANPDRFNTCEEWDTYSISDRPCPCEDHADNPDKMWVRA